MAGNIVNISTDNIDEISLLLNGAYGVLDGIFTLDNTGDVESLGKGTLSAVLDVAMRQIEEARELLIKH